MSNELKHIAIILDGNGRYAIKLGLKRIYGHEYGFKNIIQIVKYCIKMKLQHLSLFCFSTENFKRNENEVKNIFELTVKYLALFFNDKYLFENINLNIIGNLNFDNLNKKQKENLKISDFVNAIKKNNIKNSINLNKLNLNLCINYGGKNDIVNAINKILKSNKKTITEKNFKKYLFTSKIPSVDILIRTGGNHRISNFLLWDVAYAEIFFLNKLWPEFKSDDLFEIINNFKYKRIRKYGKA